MPRSLHQNLDMSTKKIANILGEKVSLNKYIVFLLSEENIFQEEKDIDRDIIEGLGGSVEQQKKQKSSTPQINQ